MNQDTPHPFVVNTTRDTFQADTVERSRTTLVVLDFWAAWCGPCRQLGPVLEKLAGEYQGRFVLVKADTNEVPEAATQFDVSGIPAVFALWDGQVVDFFQGALPEHMVRQWLDHVLRGCRVQSAKQLEGESLAEAEAEYRHLLAENPQDPHVQTGLARTLLAQERFDECSAIIAQLERVGMIDAEGRKIKATLDLRQQPVSDIAALRQAASQQPQDLTHQLNLASALARDNQFEESLEILLSLVQRDKKGAGVRARELMLQIFQAMPEDSELIPSYRRKLSLALY